MKQIQKTYETNMSHLNGVPTHFVDGFKYGVKDADKYARNVTDQWSLCMIYWGFALGWAAVGLGTTEKHIKSKAKEQMEMKDKSYDVAHESILKRQHQCGLDNKLNQCYTNVDTLDDKQKREWHKSLCNQSPTTPPKGATNSQSTGTR